MSTHEEIVEDYSTSLNDLTSNARPIIDTLTSIAQENLIVAREITAAIENRIRRAIPEHKLFALYLLDSICKNIGNPYNILFGNNLFKVFSESYVLVNDTIRQKLINLFKTWKIAKTGTGLPLFPQSQLDDIEMFLIKATKTSQKPILTQTPYQNPNPNQFSNTYNSPYTSQVPIQAPIQPPSQLISQVPSSTYKNANSQISNISLIRDINELIPIFETKLNNFPNDTKLRDRFEALNQLKMILSNQIMNENELKAVNAQLDIMKKAELKSPVIRNLSMNQFNQQPVIQSPIQPQSQMLNFGTLQNILSSNQANNPNQSNNLSNVNTSFVNYNSNNTNLLNKLNINQINTSKDDNKGGNANNLFQSLLKSGLVNNKKVETDIATVNTIEANKKLNIPSTSVLEKLLLPKKTVASNDHKSDYEIEIAKKLSGITLTQQYLNQPILNDLIQLLYESKENKCGTCGKRFSNDVKGINNRRLHLDWHFRINKKLKGEKIIQSRNWYLDDLDWCKFRDYTILENNLNDSIELVQPIKTSTEFTYVIVPTDHSEMNVKCGICTDQISAVFNDELGEWIWPNSVSVKSGTQTKIFHSNCYNETVSSNLNSNLKREREDEEIKTEKKKKINFSMLNDIISTKVKTEAT